MHKILRTKKTISMNKILYEEVKIIRNKIKTFLPIKSFFSTSQKGTKANKSFSRFLVQKG